MSLPGPLVSFLPAKPNHETTFTASPLNFIPKPLTTTIPLMQFYINSCKPTPDFKRVSKLEPHGAKFPVTKIYGRQIPLAALAATNYSQLGSGVFQGSPNKLEAIEEDIEKAIYRCRFMTLLAVFGSLTGSFLCFIKGCTYIISSFVEYFVNRGKVILLLVEAIDVYLLGTVMLVFGMGLYELFVCNLDIAKLQSKENVTSTSNLFGLFALKDFLRSARRLLYTLLWICFASQLLSFYPQVACFCYRSLMALHESLTIQ